VIYLYAIAEPGGELGSLRGVAGEPLSATIMDGLTVIAGELDATPAVTPDSLAAQDRVVRALHERVPALLPARFGSTFAARDDLQRAFEMHAIGLRAQLEQVRGREQMTLRVFTAPGTGTAPQSGAAYLRERARPPEIAALLDAVAAMVRATQIERGGHVITAYQLIDGGTSDAYREALARLVSDAVRVRVSGPGPCYAFARVI
jgi:hypothetical protein